MRKSLAVFLTLILAFSMLLAACGGKDNESAPNDQTPSDQTGTEQQPEQTKKVLHLNNNEEPGSLHPGLAQGTHDSWVLEHVFEGLMKKSPDGQIIPGMAESYDLSPDKLTYTFHLRDGITWTNGDPVTAYDFEYAWKYALNPNTGSEYAYQLYYIKGAEEFNTAPVAEKKEPTDPDPVTPEQLKALEDAVAVKATDEKTLEVTLVNPTPYFLDLTSFYTYYPVNKKVQEANPNWYTEASTYVSNGAFKLVEWRHKDSMKLVKNENYYDKDSIKLDEVDFVIIADENTAWQMYQNGELDLVYPLPAEVVAKLSAENNPEYVVAPDLSVYFYRFNTTKKPFNNLKVRQALSMAINRQDIVEHVTQGGQQPAYAITPPGIPDVTGDFRQNGGDYFKEDIEQAKQLLQEGLAEEGLDKMPPFTIIYNTSNLHKAVAEAIQQMWKQNLGLDVTIEVMDFQVKIDREHALDYEVSRAGWQGDYVDPMTFLDMWTSYSSQNDTGWTNAEFDKYINEAKTSFDTKTRMEAMHKAEEIFMKDLPVMPIYFYTKPYAVKPYVTGLYNPINRYPQFHYADITK